MARLRRDLIVRVISILVLAWAAPAFAQKAGGLHDRPTLVLDPGMNTAIIKRADVDAAGPLRGHWVLRQDGAGVVGRGRSHAAHHSPAGGPGSPRQGLRRGDQPGR
jgi:hypothetical protein